MKYVSLYSGGKDSTEPGINDTKREKYGIR